MNRKPGIIALLLCVAALAFTQVPAQTWQWAATAGGNESDKGLDLDMDADGNMYVSGYYNNPTNFNPITFGPIVAPSEFGKEGFIAKIDSLGNWKWVRPAIGGWDERVLGLCVDKINGFVYATGCCWYTTDFGGCTGTPFPGGADEIFVGKFDLNGNCQWLLGAGGSADDHGYDLVTDRQGNIYLSGFISDEYYNGTPATFGTISVPMLLGDSIAFVAKISPSGVFQWVRTFDGIDGERDNRIAVDTLGNVYVTGGFWGTKPFGPTLATSNGGNDIFVIKFDKDGNQLWLRTTGSAMGDRANGITVDKYQEVYITGEFRDIVAFGTDTIDNKGSPGGRDIFVARMTPEGDWVWASKAGSNGGEEKGNNIVSNDKGLLFVTGQFKRTAKFGSIDITSVDTVQAFVAAINVAGKWQWVLQGGGTNVDRGGGVTVDDSCNVYIAGFYNLNADFGGNSLTGLGRKDIFVARVKNGCVELGPPPPPEDTIIIPPPLPPVECEVKIPNVFSPNADGNNDIFIIEGNCIKQLNLTIFNRYGSTIGVFDSYGNWKGWDGTTKGHPVSEGVYYYVGKLELDNGEITTLEGYITLIR